MVVVLPLHIVEPPVSVLVVIAGFTVIAAAADVSEHPPEVTNLRYQVLAVSAAGA